MATDDEIIRLWKSLPKATPNDAAIRIYRLAEAEGISAMEKEVLSDSTIENALKIFGLGRGMKASFITQRAIIRAVVELAKEKAGK